MCYPACAICSAAHSDCPLCAVQVVKQVLQAMRVLLDRLSALQMMLQQKPVVSGHYTAAPYVSTTLEQLL